MNGTAIKHREPRARCEQMVEELGSLSFDAIGAANSAAICRILQGEFPDVDLKEPTVRYWMQVAIADRSAKKWFSNQDSEGDNDGD